MREAVLVIDPAHCIVEANRAAQEFFGPRAELVGLPVADVLPGWTPPTTSPASGGPQEVDLTWRPPGDAPGLMHHFRVAYLPLPGAGGAVGGWALLLHDVTASREVDASLRQQKEFFESMVRNSPVAIVTISRQFHVLSWNPAAERLFGYTPREALGENILKLVASADEVRENGEQTSKEALRRGKVHTITRRVRKDGTMVDVELLALPVAVGGEQVGFIAIYHDISALERARKEAEAANQAKSLFLATMSHEIRTPMNAIIGMTGLLLDTRLTQDQRDFVSTIRQSGEALLTLLNDILDLSKIEAGKLDLERHPFDVRQCVESVLDLLAPRASEKGLDLGCFIGPQVPPMLVGDDARLRQVLVNLVGNALKFTEKGGVAVSVEVARRPARASEPFELRISVQDSGLGITAEKQAVLFQPFIQVDASVSRRFGGTGLGLAISKRLVEAMGGRVWVDSEGVPGRGSTFHFTFCAPAAEQAPVGYQKPEQPLLRGRRVLIVDDNAISRRLLGMQLQNWGIESVETTSGPDALAWLDAGTRFDMAIVDHQMPGLDGPALAGLIRLRRSSRELPLVLLTTLGRRESQPPGVFSLVLSRPVKTSQLYDALMTCLLRDASEGQALQAHVAQQTSQFSERPGDVRPLRILLAEDNPTNQKIALLVLEKLGYPADVASSGREALRALSRQHYDVVLMDMQMPEMDGLEATRRIRNEVPIADQPWIIAMTANAMEADRQRCVEAGMDDYLSKPLRVEALVAALEHSHPRRSGEGPPQVFSDDLIPPEPPPEPVAPGLRDIPGLEPSAISRLRRGLGDQADVVLPELIDTALSNMPNLLREARSALARGDADEVGRALHTLKSNAAYFGARTLEQLCKELEKRADANALEGMSEQLTRCEAEFERTRLLLQRLRGNAA